VFGKAPDDRFLIDVELAASWDGGTTFDPAITVSDQGWDPLVNAPKSHGDPNVDFIGDYIGLDADQYDFALLWTDTRTGVQELRSAVVETRSVRCKQVPEISATILVGVVQDGGGWVIIGGKLHRIPPRSPLVRVLREAIERERVTEADVEQVQAALKRVEALAPGG
jgi:hypothetical protein